MSKDYSHIKQGMFVSLEGIEVGSELELSIIDAFVQAGARKDEGRDESFNCKMECRYNYFGWSFDYGTYFSDDEEYSGFSELVSVDFTLKGPKTSSEALQDTLEEKATEVLAKEENGSESNTGASVNISVLVSVQGNNYQLTRDQAYKLWEDLTEIFEEKIV